MGKLVDLTGRRFGRILVISYAGLCGGKNAAWNCVCDCGKEAVVRGARLRSGDTASCGCLRSDVEARDVVARGDGTLGKGDVHRSTYSTWTAMRARCLNPEHPAYPSYGGRGVTICDRWSSFDAFLEDMGYRPFDGAQLDRIDNDGPYSPQNCRWVTLKENSRNRRSRRVIDTPRGSMSVAEAADVFGIACGTLLARLARGWAGDQLFSTTK